MKRKSKKSAEQNPTSSFKDVGSGSDNESIGDVYTDEIRDFTEGRNKVSLGPQYSDSDSEEPILPLHGDDDDESDEELGEWSRRLTQIKYDNKVEKINNKKLKEMKPGGSWGDHKSAYYGAFSRIKDRKMDAEEEDDWTLEAREVDILQAKLDEEVDEEDFMIPSLSAPAPTKSKEKKVTKLTVKQDLTEKEKKEHLEKLHPEAQPLREELNRCLEELELLKDRTGWRIESKDTCFRLLAANIAFYLHLVEGGEDCRGHPVLTRIVQWKRLAKMYQEIPDHLMEESDEDSDDEMSKPKRMKLQNENNEDGMGVEMDETAEMAKDEAGRPITLQMEKNRVTTKKPKKNNPRVKHKEKFKKATVKRRVYVPEHKSEMKKYQGEERGIRAYVTKSVRLH